MSADTIVPGPGNPQAFNRYSYVLNRPTGLVDPSGHAPCSSSGGVVFCDNAGSGTTSQPSSSSVVTCAGNGCVSGGGSTIYLPYVSNQQYRPQYSSANFPRQPGGGGTSQYSFPAFTPPTSWKQPYRDAIPTAKFLTKNFWGCFIGNCSTSMQSWTGSVDFGGFWAPAAVTARGTFSVAVDHQGGVAVILSGGGGGSTPTTNIGVGVTGTNAPNVSTLTGYSVQSGGSIKSPTGQGVMAEGVVFTDKGSGQTYVGLSVSGVGSFPDPLIASVHGTFEYSWIPEIGGVKLQGNVIDWFFAPIEWVLQD